MYLSYHGATLATATASGGASRNAKFEPQVAGFLKVPNPIQLRDSFSTCEEANELCAKLIEQTITNENPETIAAVMLESICNTAGIVVLTKAFLQRVREIYDEHHVLLIFDEVLTRVAKTGRMFACQLFDVTPDILTSGKSLSGGVVPMGIMAAREKMADEHRRDYHNRGDYGTETRREGRQSGRISCK